MAKGQLRSGREKKKPKQNKDKKKPLAGQSSFVVPQQGQKPQSR